MDGFPYCSVSLSFFSFLRDHPLPSHLIFSSGPYFQKLPGHLIFFFNYPFSLIISSFKHFATSALDGSTYSSTSSSFVFPFQRLFISFPLYIFSRPSFQKDSEQFKSFWFTFHVLDPNVWPVVNYCFVKIMYFAFFKY